MKDNKIRVTEILLELGFKPHLVGYNYLREAVLYVIEDETRMHSITTKIYPHVSELFHSTRSKVERGIRTSIYVAWQSGQLIPTINKLFGVRVVNEKYNVTCGEMIALISEKVMLENI